MAFHGGALERQTDRIAAAAADAAGASLYVVAHPEPDPPHFPSTTVNGGASPALQSFLDHVRIVVTVHGYGRDGMFTSLLLGGRNRELAARCAPRWPRRCPTTRSSTTSTRSRASCAACTPTTRSTCRRTVACSSSCHRASAVSARAGRTGTATGSCRRPPRSSTRSADVARSWEAPS